VHTHTPSKHPETTFYNILIKKFLIKLLSFEGRIGEGTSEEQFGLNDQIKVSQ